MTPTITFEDFGTPQAVLAQKLVDFYEGHQVQYISRALDGYDGGFGKREDWRIRGFIPRTRNITKPIVEKGATLYQKPVKFEILPAGDPTAKPVVDAKYNEILMACDAQEFYKTVDVFTRLLKATCVLQQKHIEGPRDTVDGMYRFDSTKGDLMVPELLHRGNSVVVMNKTRTYIIELAFLTLNSPNDEIWGYRYINQDIIRDVLVKSGQPATVAEVPNGDGVVTASMRYDTGKPRTGVWPRVPEDLPSFQMLVNLHLTDLEFALATGKSQKLVLKNADIVRYDSPIPAVTTIRETNDEGRGNTLIPPGQKTEAVIGGIGSVLSLKSGKNATLAPAAEYIGPTVDLAAHDAVIRSLIDDLASDWCVKLKLAGMGHATSGFQLVVEEIDNLTLREQRAQSAQAAHRREYDITRILYPELTEGALQVIFASSSLPVNKLEQQNLWEQKVAAGFASVVDYLEAEEGLSEPEAIKRAEEIKAMNDIYNPVAAPKIVTVPGDGQASRPLEARMPSK